MKDVINPPKKPSIVLFGLSLINWFFPKILPNRYEKISKVIIIKI